MKRKEQATVRGTARVKKYNADQDVTVDEPVETVEHKFDLTKDQLEEIKKGKKVEIVNGKPQIKE